MYTAHLQCHDFTLTISHSQTSRLLTSSLSLGVPVPRTPSVCETCRSLTFNFKLVFHHHTDTHM
jgi:hypothetical protein